MAEASHVTYELILSSDSGVPTEVPRPLKDFYDKVYVARWTYSTVFTLLCVSGFISNLIIIVVFCVSKTFRLPQNLFFFSLSLADLIWTVIGSTVVVNYHLGRQAYGEIVCRSIPVVNQSVCFVNMNCHIQIALVRYICIQHPDKKAKFFRWKVCNNIIFSKMPNQQGRNSLWRYLSLITTSYKYRDGHWQSMVIANKVKWTHQAWITNSFNVHSSVSDSVTKEISITLHYIVSLYRIVR